MVLLIGGIMTPLFILFLTVDAVLMKDTQPPPQLKLTHERCSIVTGPEQQKLA